MTSTCSTIFIIVRSISYTVRRASGDRIHEPYSIRRPSEFRYNRRNNEDNFMGSWATTTTWIGLVMGTTLRRLGDM